jgi:hypothetical protein
MELALFNLMNFDAIMLLEDQGKGNDVITSLYLGWNTSFGRFQKHNQACKGKCQKERGHQQQQQPELLEVDKQQQRGPVSIKANGLTSGGADTANSTDNTSSQKGSSKSRGQNSGVTGESTTMNGIDKAFKGGPGMKWSEPSKSIQGQQQQQHMPPDADIHKLIITSLNQQLERTKWFAELRNLSNTNPFSEIAHAEQLHFSIYPPKVKLLVPSVAPVSCSGVAVEVTAHRRGLQEVAGFRVSGQYYVFLRYDRVMRREMYERLQKLRRWDEELYEMATILQQLDVMIVQLMHLNVTHPPPIRRGSDRAVKVGVFHSTAIASADGESKQKVTLQEEVPQEVPNTRGGRGQKASTNSNKNNNNSSSSSSSGYTAFRRLLAPKHVRTRRTTTCDDWPKLDKEFTRISSSTCPRRSTPKVPDYYHDDQTWKYGLLPALQPDSMNYSNVLPLKFKGSSDSRSLSGTNTSAESSSESLAGIWLVGSVSAVDSSPYGSRWAAAGPVILSQLLLFAFLLHSFARYKGVSMKARIRSKTCSSAHTKVV